MLLNVAQPIWTVRLDAIEPERETKESIWVEVARGARRTSACGDADPATQQDSITMEIYTMVPDKTTIAALKRLSDALGTPDAELPDDAE